MLYSRNEPGRNHKRPSIHSDRSDSATGRVWWIIDQIAVPRWMLEPWIIPVPEAPGVDDGKVRTGAWIAPVNQGQRFLWPIGSRSPMCPAPGEWTMEDEVWLRLEGNLDRSSTRWIQTSDAPDARRAESRVDQISAPGGAGWRLARS
eukprot:353553-Prymnesium_polylepis.1